VGRLGLHLDRLRPPARLKEVTRLAACAASVPGGPGRPARGAGWAIAWSLRTVGGENSEVLPHHLRRGQFATSFRTGPAGPLGYSQLSTIHRHGRHIQVLYLTAERTGKLDLQTSKLVPFSGIPASQLWRLDTQIQFPAR
jgi:hypothetical protein